MDTNAKNYLKWLQTEFPSTVFRSGPDHQPNTLVDEDNSKWYFADLDVKLFDSTPDLPLVSSQLEKRTLSLTHKALSQISPQRKSLPPPQSLEPCGSFRAGGSMASALEVFGGPPPKAAYIICLQWPLSVEKAKRKRKGMRFLPQTPCPRLYPKKWGIHFFRATNTTKKAEKRLIDYYSVDYSFKIDEFLDDYPGLERLLKTFWSSYEKFGKYRRRGFWKHEIQKHAKKSGLSPLRYFAEALRTVKSFHEGRHFPTKEADEGAMAVKCGVHTRAFLETALPFIVEWRAEELEFGVPIILEAQVLLDQNFKTIPGRGRVIGFKSVEKFELPSV